MHLSFGSPSSLFPFSKHISQCQGLPIGSHGRGNATSALSEREPLLWLNVAGRAAAAQVCDDPQHAGAAADSEGTRAALLAAALLGPLRLRVPAHQGARDQDPPSFLGCPASPVQPSPCTASCRPSATAKHCTQGPFLKQTQCMIKATGTCRERRLHACSPVGWLSCRPWCVRNHQRVRMDEGRHRVLTWRVWLAGSEADGQAEGCGHLGQVRPRSAVCCEIGSARKRCAAREGPGDVSAHHPLRNSVQSQCRW